MYLPMNEDEYWAMRDGDRCATPAEADLEWAHNVGRDNPDLAWIASDRDAWYPNPFYRGPPVHHPEDDNGWEPVIPRTSAPVDLNDWSDDIPF